MYPCSHCRLPSSLDGISNVEYPGFWPSVEYWLSVTWFVFSPIGCIQYIRVSIRVCVSHLQQACPRPHCLGCRKIEHVFCYIFYLVYMLPWYQVPGTRYLVPYFPRYMFTNAGVCLERVPQCLVPGTSFSTMYLPDGTSMPQPLHDRLVN